MRILCQIFGFFLSLSLVGLSETREWTSADGRTIKAELLSASETEIEIRKGSKTFSLPLEKLSEADQKFVADWRKSEEERIAKEEAKMLSLGEEQVSLNKGGITVFTLDVPTDLKEKLLEPNPEITKAKVALAVPEDFDVKKPQRVLVISITSSVKMPSSIAHMNSFIDQAQAEGWILMAAESPNLGDLKADGLDYRWAVLETGLRHLKGKWPAVKDWQFACGGNSGGAKYSGKVAGELFLEDYKVIGVYMAGCNSDTLSKALRERKPDKKPFLQIPVFISSGMNDRIATPKHAQLVKSSLEESGFKHIRLETHPEGHAVFRDHIGMGVKWFNELADASPEE